MKLHQSVQSSAEKTAPAPRNMRQSAVCASRRFLRERWKWNRTAKAAIAEPLLYLVAVAQTIRETALLITSWSVAPEREVRVVAGVGQARFTRAAHV